MTIGTVVQRKYGSRDVGRIEKVYITTARILWWHAYSSRPGHGTGTHSTVKLSALKISDATLPKFERISLDEGEY